VHAIDEGEWAQQQIKERGWMQQIFLFN